MEVVMAPVDRPFTVEFTTLGYSCKYYSCQAKRCDSRFVAGGVKVEENRRFEIPVAAVRISA